MSNVGLYQALEQAGIEWVKTQVGDKFVGEAMRANGYSLGGEESGHIIFSKHAATGDGILTSLKIMEAMLEQKQPLGELHKALTIFPKRLVNIRVKDGDAALKDEEIWKTVWESEKILGGNGRILLRSSGTEPLLRILVEAKTEELCMEHTRRIAEVIQERGYAL
jgi:phosphoglucosamine mutase